MLTKFDLSSAMWYVVKPENVDKLVPDYTTQPVVDAIKRGEEMFFDNDSTARNGMMQIDGMFYRFVGGRSCVPYEFFLESGRMLRSYLAGEKIPKKYEAYFYHTVKARRDEILRNRKEQQKILTAKPIRNIRVVFKVSAEEYGRICAEVNDSIEKDLSVFCRSKVLKDL